MGQNQEVELQFIRMQSYARGLVKTSAQHGWVLVGYNDGPACAKGFGPKGDGTDHEKVWVFARPKGTVG